MTMVSRICCSVLLFCLLMVRLQAEITANVNSKSAAEVSEFDVERQILSLPEMKVLRTIRQPRTQFTGTFHSDYTASDSEENSKMSLEQEEEYLSWEIAWPKTGKRLKKFVRVRPMEKVKKAVKMSAKNLDEEKREEIKNRTKVNLTPGVLNTRRRSKRNIFGTDNRLYIPTRNFARRFPFASVVKISTGCTGTLVSPKHVLTSAHCIHDQKDYVSGYQNLKVGLLQSYGTFRWYRVNNSYLPTGWLIGQPDIASKFDYTLLKLDNTHDKPFFKLGISENATHGARKRIHFTAFEDDKPSNTLWYRYCRIEEADAHVLYHYCDALPGSSGSGVYLWDYDADDRAWERKLIGVFSGNRWRYYKEWWKRAANFNAAIRIDSAKYTEICQWMGSHAYKTCKQKYYRFV